MQLRLLAAASLLLAAPLAVGSDYHRDVTGPGMVSSPSGAFGIALDGSAGEKDISWETKVGGTCSVTQTSGVGAFWFSCGVDRDGDGFVTNFDLSTSSPGGFDDDFSGLVAAGTTASVCFRANLFGGFDVMSVFIAVNVPSASFSTGAFSVDVNLSGSSSCTPSSGGGQPFVGDIDTVPQSNLCPSGIIGPPGPGELAVVCGVPVQDPCPSGITSPPGPGELAVVCGIHVPNAGGGTDVRSCAAYNAFANTYPGQDGLVVDNAPDGPGGNDLALCIGAAPSSTCPGGGILVNNAATCLPNPCPGGLVGTPGPGEIARVCGVGVRACTGPPAPGWTVGVVACVGAPWAVVGGASPCPGTVNLRVYWGTTPGFAPGSTSDVCI
jgi:hypothetical protein